MESKKKKPAIINLMGGLGNQMYQYAFARALQIKTGREIFFDSSYVTISSLNVGEKNEAGVSYWGFPLSIFNLDLKFASEKDTKKALKQFKLPFKTKLIDKFSKKINQYFYDMETEDPQIFNPNIFNSDKTYFSGYFINPRYFSDISDVIRKDFTFPVPQDEFNQNWLNKIQNSNSVFIHVRRGDFINLGWDLGLDYYKNAVKYMKEHLENPKFFVFARESDDYINNEFNIGCDFEFIGNTNEKNNEDWKDFYLMTQCKNGIMANSTFSFWAAYLCNNKDKIIAGVTNYNNTDFGTWIKVKSED